MAQLKPVAHGQPLRLPADDWNAVLDTTRAFQAARPMPPGGGSLPPRPGLVHVRNDSGADRDQFEVLGIDDSIFAPADELEGFQQGVALSGVAPTEDHAGRFVILAGPIPAGAIGLAHADGVCPVQVDMQAADDPMAAITDGDPSKLTSGAAGPVAVLWAEAGTGTKWAVVRFGAGGGLPPGQGLYKVLQLDSEAKPVWDYVRASV